MVINFREWHSPGIYYNYTLIFRLIWATNWNELIKDFLLKANQAMIVIEIIMIIIIKWISTSFKTASFFGSKYSVHFHVIKCSWDHTYVRMVFFSNEKINQRR